MQILVAAVQINSTKKAKKDEIKSEFVERCRVEFLDMIGTQL